MKLCEINPYIRFAEKIYFKRKPAQFNVFDCRIFSVVSGEVEIEIENFRYVLKKGDLFYCAQGGRYTIGCKNICELICFNFDLNHARSHITEKHAPLKIDPSAHSKYFLEDIVEEAGSLNSYMVLENDYSINQKIIGLIEEFENKQIYFREKASAMLKDILIDIYRKELKKSENSLDTVEKVIAYIYNNYHTKIVNSDLAKLTGYHDYHLNRIFKKQTGSTIHKYIMEVRINEAKKLIMTTDIPIYMIAQKTGFNSDTHLSNCFKNYFGYSPIEYKNNFKNRI